MSPADLYLANQWLRCNPHADPMDVEYTPQRTITATNRRRLDSMLATIVGIKFSCPRLTSVLGRLESIRSACSEEYYV